MRWFEPKVASHCLFVGIVLAVPAAADDSVRIRNDWLRMRDGVRLSVTYYLPASASKAKPVPVLLELLPYRKDDDFYERDFSLCEYFARQGLAIARVDVRGTGSSEGRLPEREYSDTELADAEQVISQLAKQEWSNGNVGMYGISWGGFNAIQVAMRRPPALKAILATDASDDLFHDDVHYIDGIFHIDEYALDIDHANGLPASPDYRVDAAYFRNRFDREPWLFAYKAHQRDGRWWRSHSLRYGKPLEVPAFLIGGLLDGYRDSVPRMLERANAPVKAIIGPWIHDWPDNAEPGPAYEWRPLAVKWWKYWLAGEKNDILDGPRLQLFVRAGHEPDAERKESPGEWRLESWPIPGVTSKRLYPYPNPELREEVPGPGFTAQPVPQAPGAGAELGYWWGEMTGDLRGLDVGLAVYDTAPLAESFSIAGQPGMRLRAQLTSDGLAHWVARLEDVAPDGKVAFVTGGALNGAQRRSRTKPEKVHGSERDDYAFNLHFTTWTFRKGHRVRLVLSNGLFPMFWPLPKLVGASMETASRHTFLELPVLALDREARRPVSPPVEPRRNVTDASSQDLSVWSPIPSRTSPAGAKELVLSGSGESAKKVRDVSIRTKETTEYAVEEANPGNARFLGTYEHRLLRDEPAALDLRLATRMEIRSDPGFFHISFTRTLFDHGIKKREKTWQKKIARDFQ